MLSQHSWLMMIHISHGHWVTICGTMVTHLWSQKCFLSYQLGLCSPSHKHGTHPLFTSWVIFGVMFRGLGVFHTDETLYFRVSFFPFSLFSSFFFDFLCFPFFSTVQRG